MSLVPASVAGNLGRHILKLKANSPRLFFAAGVVGVVGGTVLACRSTLKLQDTTENAKDRIEKVKAAHSSGNIDDNEYSKKLTVAYLHGGADLARLYALPVAVTGLSIASLTGSHVILSRRNAAVTAAYATIAKGLEEYRDRVREEFGEDKERELYHGVEWKEVDGSEGNWLEPVNDQGKWSPYTRAFDASCPEWKSNAELNRLFVQCQQNYANHLLQSRGHVFLNEVYDMLGLSRTKAGACVGWLRDFPSDDTDGYIDFGIYEAANADHVLNLAKDIVLEFNVDGVIWDLI